jgi:predicted NBD/HSP70 family sugar kinase
MVNNIKAVRRFNRKIVLNTLRSLGPISIDDIIHKTRISRPTVNTILNEYLEEKIAIKAGFAESSGGRTPALIDINGPAFYAVGVDIELPKIQLVILDLKGYCRSSFQWEVDPKENAATTLNNIIKYINEELTKNQLKKDQLLGIGAGISGLIDFQKGTQIYNERMPNWENIPIAALLTKAFTVTVIVQNDVHLQAFAEKYNNSSIVQNDDYIFLSFRSLGIGGAIIQKGEIYQGQRGNAGFFGHMTIDIHGEKCSCGNHGCLETMVNKQAVITRYKKICKKKRISTPKDIDIAYIFDEKNRGNRWARKELEYTADVLGIGIANIYKAYDISKIIIGGFPVPRDEWFFQLLTDSANLHCVRSGNIKPIEVLPSWTNGKDCALGGALKILDNYFSELP